MGRAIEPENTFLQVLLKLIPSELIAVFVFVQGMMPVAFWPDVVVTLVLIGLTPMYLSLAQGVKSRAQLAVSTLSMAVWIYAMGGGPFRFVTPPYYEPWQGAVVLAVWTLVPPLLFTQTPSPGPSRRPARPARAPVKKAAPRKSAPRRR
jgi:hypothetical protein